MSYVDKRAVERDVTNGSVRVPGMRSKLSAETNALREARCAQGMTQLQLAEIMGLSQGRVSHIESSDLVAMSLDTIKRHVEALGGTISLVANLPSGELTLL